MNGRREIAVLRIVVTGAQGFIGSALVSRLAREPDVEIIAVGRHPGASMANVFPIQADCGHWAWSSALPPRADVVVHLAQSGSNPNFPDGALDIVRVNIDATAELLDWSHKNGARRFLLASTGNVYADTSEPLIETTPCKPTSLYALTKWTAEQLVGLHGNLLQPVILRLFGVYGQGQKKGLFRQIVDAVQTGKAVTLSRGGGLRLTPLYIDDCAEALVRMALDDRDDGPILLNVAGEEVVDIHMLARMVGQLVGRDPVFKSSDQNSMALIADTTALYARLSWRPQTRLENGLARMINSAN